MNCYFVNNINVPKCTYVRRAEWFDRIIDKYCLPADAICIAGGISEYLDMEIAFLIRLAQRYPKVVYILGGCDFKSDIPLANKFGRFDNCFNKIQKNKCTPERIDGNKIWIDKLVLGGSLGFDRYEDIKKWDWWSKDKDEIYNFERNRLVSVINKEPIPDIVLSYYSPDAMQINSTAKIWHYGFGKKQEIIEKNGNLILNNSCDVTNSKYSKKDFLINL